MTKKWMVGAIVALVIVAGCKKNVQSETESSNAPSEVAANADGNSDDKGDNAQMIKSSLAERALGSAYDKARQAVEKDESSAQGAVESFIVEYDKYKLSYKAHNPAVKSFYETQLRKRTSFENAYIYYLRAIDSYELAQDDFEKAADDVRPWAEKAIASGDVKTIEAFMHDRRLDVHEQAFEKLENIYNAKAQKTAEDDYAFARIMEFAPYSEDIAKRRMALFERAAGEGNLEAKYMWANEKLVQADAPDGDSNDVESWKLGWQALDQLVENDEYGQAAHDVANRLVNYRKYIDKEIDEEAYGLRGKLKKVAHASFDAMIEKHGGWPSAIENILDIARRTDTDVSDVMEYEKEKSRVSAMDYYLYRVHQMAKRPDILGCLDIENFFDEIVDNEGVDVETDDESLKGKYSEMGRVLVKCYENLIERGLDYSDVIEGTAAEALSRLYGEGKMPFVARDKQKSEAYRAYDMQRR